MEKKTWTAERTAWRMPRTQKEVYALVYDPTPGGVRNPDGTTSRGLRFPALVVTDIVEGAETIARKVADELNAAKETEATISRLTEERDEARQLVAEANNSLYGSQGYFHSLNGGPFDKYHLATGIENLKDGSRKASRLTFENAALKHDIDRHLSIMTEMQTERERLQAQVSGLKQLSAAQSQIATRYESLWVCDGCGTLKSMEQIKGEHPPAIACCPERKMRPPTTALPDAEQGSGQ